MRQTVSCCSCLLCPVDLLKADVTISHKSFLSCAGLFPMRRLCCCAATQDKRNCPKKCPHGLTSQPANSTDNGPRPARPLQSVWLFISVMELVSISSLPHSVAPTPMKAKLHTHW